HRADRHPPDSPPTPAMRPARHRAVAVDAASTNAPYPQDHQSPDRAPATPPHLPEAPPTCPTNPSNPPDRKAPSYPNRAPCPPSEPWTRQPDPPAATPNRQ